MERSRNRVNSRQNQWTRGQHDGGGGGGGGGGGRISAHKLDKSDEMQIQAPQPSPPRSALCSKTPANFIRPNDIRTSTSEAAAGMNVGCFFGGGGGDWEIIRRLVSARVSSGPWALPRCEVRDGANAPLVKKPPILFAQSNQTKNHFINKTYLFNTIHTLTLNSPTWAQRDTR